MEEPMSKADKLATVEVGVLSTAADVADYVRIEKGVASKLTLLTTDPDEVRGEIES